MLLAPAYQIEVAVEWSRYKTMQLLPDEEIEPLALLQLANGNHRTALISTVRVKNVLGDIRTNCGNL